MKIVEVFLLERRTEEQNRRIRLEKIKQDHKLPSEIY
jgi:hypothetical protein